MKLTHTEIEIDRWMEEGSVKEWERKKLWHPTKNTVCKLEIGVFDRRQILKVRGFYKFFFFSWILFSCICIDHTHCCTMFHWKTELILYCVCFWLWRILLLLISFLFSFGFFYNYRKDFLFSFFFLSFFFFLFLLYNFSSMFNHADLIPFVSSFCFSSSTLITNRLILYTTWFLKKEIIFTYF